MNCEEAKGYVDGYIKNVLPERKQEEFIKHVKACPECFQELETYFIVDVAMRYFDDNKEDTYDIRNLLQNDLDKRLKKRQRKKRMVVMLIILSIIFVLATIGLLVQWFI